MNDKRKYPPFLIPCPICNGVEGCDHTVLERARAASTPRTLSENDIAALSAIGKGDKR